MTAVAELIHETLRLKCAPAMALDKFTNAYLDTGLCATYIDDTGITLRFRYTRLNFSIESLAKAREVCMSFQVKCRHLYWGVGQYIGKGSKGAFRQLIQDTDTLAGTDFWFTCTHAGVGFWDGDWKHGDELTEGCRPFVEPCIYIGDDGILYYE